MRTINADQFLSLRTPDGRILVNRNHIESVFEDPAGGSRVYIHGAKYHHKVENSLDQIMEWLS